MEKLIITIPKPCNENWDAMTPVEQGRFCEHCQKKVIDFSRTPDAEVIRIFREAADGPPCGRFHISQVGRELVQPKKVSFGTYLLRRLAASLLLFQAFATTAWSQTVGAKTHQGPKATVKNQLQKNIVVRGKVVDADGDVPLKGIIVSAEGYSSTTNAKGVFTLQFSHRFINRTLFLKCSYSKLHPGPHNETDFGTYELILDSMAIKKDILINRMPVINIEPVEQVYLTGVSLPNLIMPDSNFLKKKIKVTADDDSIQIGKMKKK